ncbi:LOW QUALITY PROTEIN: ring canal kelch homolog [Rhopalosiphum maidis]|uniref:LOW QUALITY PROTEIN: ring canal kelch homolog n=1 Tax=Rhopalosiphum maidis TaxID=43146 RepID=UPI000EFEE803|nr:LOW QUALITY PROTEIN: ring canal kelch homolog [Rhopalosiphum maidis]
MDVQKLGLKSNKCEPGHFKNSSHKDRMFEVLQSSRNQGDNFCDIKLQTDDGTIVFGHKNILASATPYFKAMFSSFAESNKDLVNIGEVDSTILQLLIDYIYTGEIMITQQNVQIVLPTADLFQLEYVKQVCIDFLQKQLDPSNCLSIKIFADLYNCIELLSSCETYIKKQFLKVVEHDEFLSLSSEEVIKLISFNDINVPFEEKVFECVIKWVKHELYHRKKFLPNLMEHVRLPLISKEYFSEKVVVEPLLNNNRKAYVFEAFRISLIKSTNPSSIPQTIWSKPRLQQQAILVFGWSPSAETSITYWYEPGTNLMCFAPKMIESRNDAGLCVVKDHFVFAIGGVNLYGYTGNSENSVEMLDVSSSSLCWVSKANMLVNRNCFGIGVLDNCIYAIGGLDRGYPINSVEVFNLSTEQWKMVSSMPNERYLFGVGVLNDLIYAVGGYNGSSILKSVECYDPSLDKWNPVAEMSISRYNVSVEVLDGVMYAIGGYNGLNYVKSVEAYSPSAGVWSSIADMHLCRENPGVVAFGGFLCVIGGKNGFTSLNSVEIYNSTSNSWSMKTIPISHQIYGAVVVDKPPHLQTN